MLVRSTRHQSLLRADDTLLLVVDMQEPFLRNAWERDRIVRNVTLLIRAAKILQVPVVPTLQYAERMGDLIPEIAKLLPPSLTPFDKLCFSALGEDAVAYEIQRSGRKQVLVCGVETHICISQSAHDLLALGFQVHVAADAVSSRAQSNWEIGLERMQQAGALLTSSEMALYEMLYEDGTPEFRDILQLVK